MFKDKRSETSYAWSNGYTRIERENEEDERRTLTLELLHQESEEVSEEKVSWAREVEGASWIESGVCLVPVGGKKQLWNLFLTECTDLNANVPGWIKLISLFALDFWKGRVVLRVFLGNSYTVFEQSIWMLNTSIKFIFGTIWIISTFFSWIH